MFIKKVEKHIFRLEYTIRRLNNDDRDDERLGEKAIDFIAAYLVLLTLGMERKMENEPGLKKEFVKAIEAESTKRNNEEITDYGEIN